MNLAKKLLLLIFLCSIGGLSAAERVNCTVCSKKIRGRYIIDSRKRAFCSEKCFEQTLPTCANCRKLCRGNFLKVKSESFCSRQCADNKLLPRCSRCSKPCRKFMVLPTGYGTFTYCIDCYKLDKCLVCYQRAKKLYLQSNGNKLCRYCNRDVITNLAQLQSLFNEVRNTLHKNFNFPADHPITLEMRSFTEQEKSSLHGGNLFGLYNYQGKIVRKGKLFSGKKTPEIKFRNEHCTIIILGYLPRRKAAEAIAHELAHDYMKHRWFFIKDEKIKEGFAEFIAAQYNTISGSQQWNICMEKNPDKIYGDGYREMCKLYKQGSFPALFRLFDRINLQDTPSEYR